MALYECRSLHVSEQMQQQFFNKIIPTSIWIALAEVCFSNADIDSPACSAGHTEETTFRLVNILTPHWITCIDILN